MKRLITIAALSSFFGIGVPASAGPQEPIIPPNPIDITPVTINVDVPPLKLSQQTFPSFPSTTHGVSPNTFTLQAPKVKIFVFQGTLSEGGSANGSNTGGPPPEDDDDGGPLSP